MTVENDQPTTQLEVWARNVGMDLTMWVNWLQDRMDALNEALCNLRRSGLGMPTAHEAIGTMYNIIKDMKQREETFRRIEELEPVQRE